MWYFILFFATLVVDQLSKIIVEQANPSITIIPGILNINLSYNPGASFSFLANKSWAQAFFIILTSIVLIAGFLFLILKKPKGKWLLSSIALLFSGTIGNFIDRIAIKQVRDFIDVPFFANFNIADCCLCVGAGMLIFYVLFLDKEALFKPIKKAEPNTATVDETVITEKPEVQSFDSNEQNSNDEKIDSNDIENNENTVIQLSESGDNEVIAQNYKQND